MSTDLPVKSQARPLRRPRATSAAPIAAAPAATAVCWVLVMREHASKRYALWALPFAARDLSFLSLPATNLGHAARQARGHRQRAERRAGRAPRAGRLNPPNT